MEKITALTLDKLADKCTECDLAVRTELLDAIQSYNKAVEQHRRKNPGFTWNPAVKDEA